MSETRFDACEHPAHVKYVVGGRGIVCTKCDPDWYINPLLERENPASTRLFRETFDRVASCFPVEEPTA